MTGELGAVVEGDGLAPVVRERSQELGDGISHALGRFGKQGTGKKQAGVAFLEGEERLPSVAKGHEVGLPVTWIGAVVSFFGALGQGLAKVNKGNGTAAPASSAAPPGLATGQQMAPGVVLPAVDLGLDEAVDSLVGYEGAASFQSQATGYLLWGPASLQAGIDGVAQVSIPVQPGSPPATGPGLLVSVNGFIAFLAGGVAVQLPRNCRWRAIQACRDLAPSVSLLT